MDEEEYEDDEEEIEDEDSPEKEKYGVEIGYAS